MFSLFVLMRIEIVALARPRYYKRLPKQKDNHYYMRTFIIIIALLAVSGCTSMLLGADVAPVQQRDTDEDERSKKDD